MQVSIISTLYLAALLQAGIMIFVIVRKTKVLYSEKYLVAVLAALGMTFVHYVALLHQLISLRSIFMTFGAISWMTISPLLYLYSKSLLGYENHWQWKNLLYFPFSIFLVIQMALAVMGKPIRLYVLFNDPNSFSIAWIMAYLVNSLVFSVWSILTLLKADISEKHRERLRWLIRYFQLFSAVLIGLTLMLLRWLNANFFFYQLEYILLLFYALFIFSLVAMSLRFSHYFGMISNDQYGHDRKDEEELATLFNQFITHFEKEKPYLSPKLSLAELAKTTQLTENQLSQIFTRYLKSSFYQFINEYRLKEFECQLTRKGTKQYTIMALAECAGFASKATFYKVFKAHYDMTPTEFIKSRARF